MANCSICLDRLKNPVVTPCGHLHCGECLAAHIRSGIDEMHSACPTCRATFNIVSPDLAFVPKKYHTFILPSIRKVFFETTVEKDLKAKVAQLEARVQTLEKEKSMLMERCESSQAAAASHAAREKAARMESVSARKEVDEFKKKYNALQEKSVIEVGSCESLPSAENTRPVKRKSRHIASANSTHTSSTPSHRDTINHRSRARDDHSADLGSDCSVSETPSAKRPRFKVPPGPDTSSSSNLVALRLRSLYGQPRLPSFDDDDDDDDIAEARSIRASASARAAEELRRVTRRKTISV